MFLSKANQLFLVLSILFCLAFGLTGQAYADQAGGSKALNDKAAELDAGICGNAATQTQDALPHEKGIGFGAGGTNTLVSDTERCARESTDIVLDDETEGVMLAGSEVLIGDSDSTQNGEEYLVSAPLIAQDQSANTIVDGVYTIASAVSASVQLEIGGASQSNGAGTNVYSNNWTPAQRWYITSLDNGYYKLMNVASGKYLDVASAKVGNGARVQQYAWNGTQAQQWAIESVDGAYKLYSALSKDYLLDLSGASTNNGTKVQLYQSNNTKAQRWVFSRVDQVLPDGVYTATVASSGKALDVSSASVSNNANVQQYDSNGTMAQSFHLSYSSSSGYYTVINAASGLALDVAGAVDSNGANVQMYTPNGTRAQLWAIVKNSDGTVTLHSAVGGRALDVSGASQSNGANVQTYAPNGTKAQRWLFAGGSAWALPEGVYNIVTAVNRSNSLAVESSSRIVGANVQTAATSSTSWGQKWLIAKATDGYYTIRNLNSRMMLDVASASTKSGANVSQYTQNDTVAQFWKPELTSGGILFRAKTNNSLVLDVASASTWAGANVQVYTSNGTAAQKFAVRAVGVISSGTTYVLSNIGADKVLDVESASSANGAAVQLYAANGTAAQKFRLISAGGDKYYLQNIGSGKYVDVNTSTKTTVRQWEGQSGSGKQWELVLDMETGAFTAKSVYTGTYLDGTSGTLSLKTKDNSDTQRFALQPLVFKLFLDAGHIVGTAGADSGAVGNGYTEADLTADLTSRIYRICTQEYGLDVVDGKTYGIPYTRRPSKAVELGCTVLVSIHFNAGGGTGYMGIVGSADRRNANSPTLATLMHTYLGQGMSGMRDNGVSTRGDLLIPNDSRIPATLLEVAFIDNSYDMQVYNARRDTVARSLAQGILEASMRGEFNG